MNLDAVLCIHCSSKVFPAIPDESPMLLRVSAVAHPKYPRGLSEYGFVWASGGTVNTLSEGDAERVVAAFLATGLPARQPDIRHDTHSGLFGDHGLLSGTYLDRPFSVQFGCYAIMSTRGPDAAAWLGFLGLVRGLAGPCVLDSPLFGPAG